jgi:hypothetical protein
MHWTGERPWAERLVVRGATLVGPFSVASGVVEKGFGVGADGVDGVPVSAVIVGVEDLGSPLM